ncbi:hypothetical protein V1478_006628 [Vespula squamosa]|uniref:Uncharacterized protein n=1 Tax=Vespula squamosa TaxID=30214 RepID=A0ABD2B8D2_VESSQ
MTYSKEVYTKIVEFFFKINVVKIFTIQIHSLFNLVFVFFFNGIVTNVIHLRNMAYIILRLMISLKI